MRPRNFSGVRSSPGDVLWRYRGDPEGVVLSIRNNGDEALVIEVRDEHEPLEEVLIPARTSYNVEVSGNLVEAWTVSGEVDVTISGSVGRGRFVLSDDKVGYEMTDRGFENSSSSSNGSDLSSSSSSSVSSSSSESSESSGSSESSNTETPSGFTYVTPEGDDIFQPDGESRYLQP